ncbi:MAG: hypothetical protein JWL69_1329 [Phycisphaerales bacterium]|nr:hypothetical protein [Phycisphaerales bacterium]MDB5357079.1 hypothetical protein [Phycisphaerales bacterium]
MRLLDGYLKKSVQIGFTMPTWHVVPDRVKKLIEHSDLGGVTFKPTLLLSGTYADADAQPIPWDSYGEPWWELDANLTMPPLSDSMMFTDSDGRVLKERDFSNGFHRKEGLYLHPELHYRALDLAKLPPFDLARTYEPFGNRRGYDRTDCPLVASQRFYDFCEQHGLKTGWVPVRIEQD